MLLYVHGSGPRNSSMFWNEVVQAVDALSPDAYYHVAIDCPGYGRSSGDRQIIRSYPGQFLEGVTRACGKRSAAALIGSSQGACAVMNALLERPLLAEAVAIIHPVGHAVDRYKAIKQPALLIFDTEDAGHPVEVGRRMRDALPCPTYFEFTRSVHGPWEQRHIAPELMKLLHATSSEPIRRSHTMGTPLPELSVLAGGLRAWSERHGDEHGWDRPASGGGAVEEETEEGVISECWSGRESTSLALTSDLLAPPPLDEALFSDDGETDEEQVAAAAEAAARARAEAELQQRECELCGTHLSHGAVRLVRCRHALCACCCDWSLRHFEECPVCQAKVDRGHRPRSASKTALVGLPAPRSDEASLCVQVPLPTASSSRSPKTAAPPDCVLVISYGNTSERTTSGKTNYITYVQVVHGERSALAKVSFNINPGYKKPTATLAAPNGAHGRWSFDYAMARPYPCEITLQFKNGLPPLTLKYWVQDQTKFARCLAIELPLELKATGGASYRGGGARVTRTGGIVLEKEHCTSSGWFLKDTDNSSGWSFRPANCGA